MIMIMMMIVVVMVLSLQSATNNRGEAVLRAPYWGSLFCRITIDQEIVAV